MKRSILVVEDNADTRYLLGLLLESAGHEVRTVGTMRDALDELHERRADVLLSDLGLPDGSGLELLVRLRRTGHVPYAVAMSGLGAQGDIASSLAAGFRRHLVKPIDIEEVAALIEGPEADAPARR